MPGCIILLHIKNVYHVLRRVKMKRGNARDRIRELVIARKNWHKEKHQQGDYWMVHYEFLQRQIEHYRNFVEREQMETNRLFYSQQREKHTNEKRKEIERIEHQLAIEKKVREQEQRISEIATKNRKRKGRR